MNDWIKIVEDLKKKNTSVFILSYDDEIDPEKINNIHSFLNGFFEGYFFQIKNYQQLKQIFINISKIKYQSNFLVMILISLTKLCEYLKKYFCKICINNNYFNY